MKRQKQWMHRLVSLSLATLIAMSAIPVSAAEEEPVAGIAIDETNFPDEAFRNYILEEIDGKTSEDTVVDAEKDGFLSEAEIQYTTNIDINGMGIEDLTGISYFTSTNFFICSNNLLQTLDVSGMSRLTVLMCDDNPELSGITLPDSAVCFLSLLSCEGCRLTALDVSKCTMLSILDCGKNQLTALDISKCTMLSTLHCASNSLTALDVTEHALLENLDCSQNQLSELNVANNTALTSLNCASNALTELDVVGLSALETLDCGENQLSELNVANNTALTSLNCASNALTELDVVGLSALETLDCGENQLSELNVANNTALTSLNCASNALTELNVVGLSALETLDCSENQLHVLDVSGNTVLTSLNCSGNQLVALDVTGLSLETLLCNRNQRAIVPVPRNAGLYTYDLTQMPELDSSRIDLLKLENAALLEDEPETLYILDASVPVKYAYQIDQNDSTCLAEFTLTLDTDLNKYLEISAEKFPDAAFRSALSAYDIDQNGWFSLDELQSVTSLSLRDSNVQDLTGISLLYWLETLDCSGSSSLHVLDVSSSACLKELICSSCELTSLTLPLMPVLESLDCRNNALTALDLTRQVNLSTLFCDCNQLTFLDTDGTQLMAGTLSAEDNLFAIMADVNGQIDLTTMPEGFSVERVVPDSWGNASVSGMILTVQDLEQPVSYRYYTDTAQTSAVQFSLSPQISLLPIDEAHFPDMVFRNLIAVYDMDGDGFFSRAELQAVTTLSIASSDIGRLTGIQYFTELTELNCASNGLKTLDLTGLEKLQYLDCSQNAIETLVLPQQSVLETLNCTSNNLQTLSTENLLALKYLKCDQNHLTKLDLSASAELITLSCSMNYYMEELNIAGLRHMTSLNCSQNRLTELDFTGHEAITTLICAGNRLTELDVTPCPQLEYLNCSTNQLTALEISSLSQLNELLCIGNQLTSLAVPEGVSLEKLSADSNQYTISLDRLNRFRFSDLPGSFDINRVVEGSWTNAMADRENLYVTDPSENITYTYLTAANDPESGVTFTLVPQKGEDSNLLPIDEAHFPDPVFRAYVQKKFDIENDWYFSTSELLNADVIEVPGMDVTDLTGVEYFSALKRLDCSSNQLTTLSALSLLHLEELNCSGNALESLYLPSNGSMQKLFCAYNVLTSLDVSAVSSLTYLSCAANLLTELNISGLSSMEYLYCYDNALTELDLSGLSSLTYLDCSDNQLTSLDLTELTELQKLQCQNNQMISLDVTGLNALDTIDVSGNLYVIPVKAVSHFDLTTLPAYFQLERVTQNSWGNAVCDGTTLTIQDLRSTVTYSYQIDAKDPSRTVIFTLVPQLVEEDTVSIEASVFPDLEFRTYVAENLDINQDGLLAVSEWEAVTSMDVSDLGITDLTGISHFTELVELNCANNQLTRLENLPVHLTSLDCSGNQLHTVSIEALTELTVLNCSANPMGELNLAEQTALTELRCRNCQLKQLNVIPLQSLLFLDCGENQLTSLRLTHAKMTDLLCDGNGLTKLDITKLPELLRLNCSDNVLQSLNCGGGKLAVLQCTNNLLKSLDVSKLSALEELECAENRLSALDLSAQSALTTLNAGSNPLLALCLSPTAEVKSCQLENCHALVTPVLRENHTLYVDVSAWSGFDLACASGWKNASLDGAGLIVTDPLKDVTYTYDTGNPNVTATFSVGMETVPMEAARVVVETWGTLYYTGEPQVPEITVFLGETTLHEGQDYTITYEDNINAGIATAIITAAGSQLWSGSCEATYSIEKAVPKVSVALDTDAQYTEGDAVPVIKAADGSTSGMLSWMDDTPDVLSVGSNTLYWRFIPDDTMNYQIITGSVTLRAEAIVVTTTSESTASASTTTTMTTITKETSITALSSKTTANTILTTTQPSTTSSKVTLESTQPTTTSKITSATTMTNSTTTTSEATIVTSSSTATTNALTSSTTTSHITRRTIIFTTKSTTTAPIQSSTMTSFTRKTAAFTTITTTMTLPETSTTVMDTTTTEAVTEVSTVTTTASDLSMTTSDFTSTVRTSSTTVTTASTTSMQGTTVSTQGTTVTQVTKVLPKIKGDANMDNVVDTMDAYLVLLYYARVSVGMEDCKLNEEQDTFTNRWLLLLVDVNGDNQIDTMDAYYILLYYAMKSAGFETSWDIVLQ